MAQRHLMVFAAKSGGIGDSDTIPEPMYPRADKEYRKRLMAAAVVAACLHAAALASLAWITGRHTADRLTLAAEQQPLVVRVLPPESPRRLIDAGTLAAKPVAPNTDLIAEQDMNAADMSDAEGPAAAPRVERLSEFDQVEGASHPPAPAAPPKPTPIQQEPQRTPLSSPPEPQPTQRTEVAALELPRAQTFEPQTAIPPEDDPTPKIEPAPPARPDRPAQPRGRVEGGVKDKGLLSFEAHRNEMAPYLLAVRQKVENRWRAILQTRYSGTAATKAVLDCAIGPDGALVYVRIVDPGDSPTYAYLCKEAIEQSGPFGRFPVEIPAFFRSQNIEIRWTFSFFM